MQSLFWICAIIFTTSFAIRPKFSWDYLGNMTFFHSCNETGLYNERALRTITKFPFVTIEKGQGWNDGSQNYAETKIKKQLEAIKEIDPSICTVLYMNGVLDWYFYHMHVTMLNHSKYWLRNSKDGKPVYTSGDKHFNPPKEGMLVFDHSKSVVRDWWSSVCLNAVATGHVDGCFSDSSQPGTHGTSKHLNESDNAAFEAGKVAMMTNVVEHFGGTVGKPYKGNGVIIGKKPDQKGINAYQIEMFGPSNTQIEVLLAGVAQGYLVQAHVSVNDVASKKGCSAMNDSVAAFLIGAGPNCYYGTGTWISSDIDDVESRWCPPLFERPLGEPLGNATKNNGIWKRQFSSGTSVEFNTKTNKGTIHWVS